ncbi:MAG TPA: lipid A deacylase LpxR family protein [Planctomycetota bacterium]|nr:lipid A deacylase LpxR family protein [Planctomycetota bacterium]
MHHRAHLALALALACAGAGAAEDRGGTASLAYDNDFIADSDDGYSGGIHLGYVSRDVASFEDAPVPDAIGRAFARLPLVDRAGRRCFVAYGLSQLTYTPEDTASDALVVDDIPYSGLLLFSTTAAAHDATHLDAFTLIVGVVGPSSLAQEVQDGLHRATGSDLARGWDHQLADEPILDARYEHRWRAYEVAIRGRTCADAIVSGGAEVGNLATRATIGLGVRIGLDVPQDTFVPPPLHGQESVGALSRAAEAPARRWTIHLALGIDASLVGNLIQLDGNTFRDSHRVDHEHWIARGHAGLHARVGRAAVSLALVQASVPWDRPDGERWERYGRAMVGWDW